MFIDNIRFIFFFFTFLDLYLPDAYTYDLGQVEAFSKQNKPKKSINLQIRTVSKSVAPAKSTATHDGPNIANS